MESRIERDYWPSFARCAHSARQSLVILLRSVWCTHFHYTLYSIYYICCIYCIYTCRHTLQPHYMHPINNEPQCPTQHGLDEATNNSQGWYRVDWLSCYIEFTVEQSDYITDLSTALLPQGVHICPAHQQFWLPLLEVSCTGQGQLCQTGTFLLLASSSLLPHSPTSPGTTLTALCGIAAVCCVHIFTTQYTLNSWTQKGKRNQKVRPLLLKGLW